MSLHRGDVLAAQVVWNRWRGILISEDNTIKMLTEVVETVSERVAARAWDEAHDKFCPQGFFCSAHQPRTPKNSDRECLCEVIEHVPDCPSWGV